MGPVDIKKLIKANTAFFRVGITIHLKITDSLVACYKVYNKCF